MYVSGDGVGLILIVYVGQEVGNFRVWVFPSVCASVS